MNLFSIMSLVGGVNEAGGSHTRVARANATIGLKNGQLIFASSGFYYQPGNGGSSSGMVLESGELDISNMRGGDVSISIALNDEIWNAGYRFPSDIYQAVAIAYYPPNSTNVPPAVFGQANWPGEFDAPSFADGGQKLQFVDKNDDDSTYEYSIAINKPDGQRIVLDPKIKNGGQQ